MTAIRTQPGRLSVHAAESHRAGPFLASRDLLDAIRGDIDRADPMVRWARDLGDHYAHGIRDPDAEYAVKQAVGEIVTQIDVEIRDRLPVPRPGSQRGILTAGEMVAKVAEATACASWTLRQPDPGIRHLAWEHLAEIAQGYDDLVRLIMSGSIILPKSWPGLPRRR